MNSSSLGEVLAFLLHSDLQVMGWGLSSIGNGNLLCLVYNLNVNLTPSIFTDTHSIFLGQIPGLLWTSHQLSYCSCYMFLLYCLDFSKLISLPLLFPKKPNGLFENESCCYSLLQTKHALRQLRMPTPYDWVPTFESLLQSQLELLSTVHSGRQWIQVLRSSTWFLALSFGLAHPSLLDIWGINQWMTDLFLSISSCTFQTPEIIQ